MINRYVSGSSVNVGKLLKEVGGALLALIFVLWVWPFAVVPTGYNGVITTFGKITSIQSEGLAFVPAWQKIANLNMRSQAAQVENAEGSTSDTQPVAVNMTVRYSIQKSKLAKVYEDYTHDGDMSSYVQTATQEVFKAVTAKFTATDLISKRGDVSNAISMALREKLSVYGVQVNSIDMTGFGFSKDYMAAINAKVTQEQLRLGAENKLKTVEAEQKQKIAVAEAEASAAKATADGEAYANLTVAKAQAESLRIQGSAIQANPGVLRLREIEVEMKKAGEGWNGVLPTTVYGTSQLPVQFQTVK